MLDQTSRRRFLGAMAGASAAGLAGCFGDEDTTTLNLSTPGSGTVSATTANALQRAVQQESDSIRLRLEETSGDPASIRQFADGELDGYTSGLDISVRARDEREPFDTEPVDTMAQQVLPIASLHHYWVATDGSGVETFDDIVDMDVDVFALPPGWGLRRLAEEVLGNAGVWEEMEDRVVNLEVGEVAGAIDEGRIDAALIYGANYSSLAGWAEEVDARNDLHVVESTDTLTQGIEGTDSTYVETIEPYGWEQDVGADEVDAWPMPFHIYLGEDVSNDAAAELCRISHEENDVVREADDTYLDHSDIQAMADGITDQLPVHPGAQEYYEDNGAEL